MAVMNDVLRSPQLSKHLSSQSQSAGLPPMHGRPRSRTAPSTPLVELAGVEPVELPGSLLVGNKSDPYLPQSAGGATKQALVESSTHAALGAGIERPHTTPHYATDILPGRSPAPLHHVSESSILHLPAQVSPRSKSSSPHRYSDKVGTSLRNSGEKTRMSYGSDSTTTTNRPSLSIMQKWPSHSFTLPGSGATSNNGSTQNIPQLVSSQLEIAALNADETPADIESILIEQISEMRTLHEAHLNSLKEAHEKEIASHRSYITFLEKRRVLPPVPRTPAHKQTLTIDTSHSAPRAGDLLHSDTSANTLQSFESSLENQKRVSQEAAAEVEALKRKLSLCKKSQIDAVEVRRERDQLREAADRSDRRIVQLKDLVRKAKDNEKALRNGIEGLEARLVTANNERTDVLEGFHEACEQARQLSAREKALSSQLKELQSRASYPAQSLGSGTATLGAPEGINAARPRHVRTVSDLVPRSDSGGPLMDQLRDLQYTVAAKDARIRQLEHETAAQPRMPSPDEQSQLTMQAAKVLELESSLQEHKQKLEAAQADSERYNSLLHNELRRQTRSTAEKAHNAPPKIEAEAFTVAAEKMVRLKARTESSSASDSTKTGALQTDDSAAMLEKELEHCIKEIILYKLDIRGYKKDLHKANLRIERLQATSARPPPTPDRESNTSSARSNTSVAARRGPPFGLSERIFGFTNESQSGLGISVPEHLKTPTKTVASATSAALLSATPSPRLSALSSPPPRPRTPLGAHKKLPKPPPSRTPSPLPATWPQENHLQRAETLRSLSDSIISSYAQRTTPEQKCETTPPSRERSSEPVRTLGSTAPVPISKFASQQPMAAPVQSGPE